MARVAGSGWAARSDAVVETLRAELDQFWSSALAAFKETVEQRMKETQ